MSDAAVDWLLQSDEPAVRLLARRDLLGEPVDDPEAVLSGARVQALLTDRGGRPYSKWTGAHWRLVSLVELGVRAGEPRAVAAAETVLGWLGSKGRPAVPVIDGLPRAHASIDGNALAVCCRLGMAGDARVERLARDLVAWQWPDGGWNCAVRASGRRSSFHESLIPAWGLHEYATAAHAPWAREAALRTAELLLDHRLFRRLSTGRPIDSQWLRPRYPPYWHYDILQALLVLGRLGVADDPRAEDARAEIRARRRPDGLWPANGSWIRGRQLDVVDWGGRGPSEMLTLNALRVLR